MMPFSLSLSLTIINDNPIPNLARLKYYRTEELRAMMGQLKHDQRQLQTGQLISE